MIYERLMAVARDRDHMTMRARDLLRQQGKTYEEIQAQWYDDGYWTRVQDLADPIDELICAFNRLTGLG